MDISDTDLRAIKEWSFPMAEEVLLDVVKHVLEFAEAVWA